MAPGNDRIGFAGLSSAIVAACLIVGAFAAWFAPSASAAVEEQFQVTHLYNEAHSLTGGCGVSTLDKVPDPACTEVPKGPLPPEGPLVKPHGMALDAYGDQYVINRNESEGPDTANIDIFDPDGHYIGGFNVNETVGEGFSNVSSVETAAVDSTGHLYLALNALKEGIGGRYVVRFDPTTYKPQAEEIAYGSAPVVVSNNGTDYIAVNPANDHFYMSRGDVVEYGAAVDGVPNEVLREDIGKGSLRRGGPIAIDAQHNKLYIIDSHSGFFDGIGVTIVVLSATAPFEQVAEFDGSTTPGNKFESNAQESFFSITVDEESGDFFFSHGNVVYELEPDGTYVETVNAPPQQTGAGNDRQLAYDNSELSPNKGYLYIPTGQVSGHLYAYEPIREPELPVVESIFVTGVSEDEAVLHASVNPSGEAAHYVFEYTTQQAFEENEASDGFAGAQVAGEGDTPLSGEGVPVFAAVRGLSAGTAYRFRVRAENQCEPGGCEVEAQGAFTTFAPYAQTGSCSNAPLRTGASAALPDCRAYELVTPPSTDGRVIIAPGFGSGPNFATWNSSPDGASIAFSAEGGALSGQDTPGAFNGDNYVARRGANGWQTETAGLTARQASSGIPGGLSSDHGFAVVTGSAKANLDGELVHPGEEIDFIRYPDGSVHVAGEGSIGTAKLVRIRYISAGGGHIVFNAGSDDAGESGAQLEPNAPPEGTSAIYDRTPDLALHVVSLLPGDVTPAGGQSAHYLGVSTDGSVVAFQIAAGSEGSGPLYLRLDNAETVEGAPAGSTFAGLSDNGRYLFYLSGGALYRYDSQEDATAPFSEGAEAAPAYVSADGSSAYFTSPSVLPSPAAPVLNPRGDAPAAPAKGSGVLGAKGTATLTEGSTKVTAVSVSEGALKVGMTISGTGIAAGTTITALGAGTLTLSQAAEQSGVVSFTAVGSDEVTGVSTSEGAFEVGMGISGTGIPAGTTIEALGPGTLTLSKKTTIAGPSNLTASFPNLYLAREGQIRFIATVTEADVEGDSLPGFKEWLKGINSSGLLPLRATPEGSTLLFASRADLASFKSGGVAQIYRYDENEGRLDCLSCDPTQKAPSNGAALLTPLSLPDVVNLSAVPATASSIVPNLSPDGRRAFFESEERLLPADEDGLRDVYEWEAQGKGSCAQEGGCLFLISSGQSTRDDYLYGVSESGDDVFIYTADLLNGEDVEEAPSVYDAKVQGGFAPRQAPAGECQGEACQPAAVAPQDPTPASSSFEGSGNVRPEGEAKARCPKGKKAARKGGKTRCVPRHHKKKGHKRANANRRAGR